MSFLGTQPTLVLCFSPRHLWKGNNSSIQTQEAHSTCLLLSPCVLGIAGSGGPGAGCLGDFPVCPGPTGSCPVTGLGNRDAQKAVSLGRDQLGESAWGMEGASRAPSGGLCPAGHTWGSALHQRSGWEPVGGPWVLSGLRHTNGKVTSTPPSLSHAEVWREAGVSRSSEIPQPGLERRLGRVQVGV